ncbi:uncharacterized protein PFL1_00665 [Pseudozyma flocculosa PF-1]|uniref:uncharacterized protein n=1 Tax=Pseudozyma flocculosa PF-1 TaxID=1277687 RepID=UPI000455FFE5|nr:uncharacterized protein PFL1_00665 [Pseudozyma flocculosa PF-1]EPQ32470.1 hypothetical protein PFL1_00665 [Pseudozyma flocculosa PF-1]
MLQVWLRSTSAIQAVAGQFGSDKDGAKEGPRSPDEKAASASSGVIAKEREHLDRVRQLLVDGVCSTMTDCAAMLAESTSIELEAQMRVHFRDRRKLLRADRRALVRKYRAKLAEHEAHEGTTIQTETTLQLIGQLALL